jgi:hypothetical protein
MCEITTATALYISLAAAGATGVQQYSAQTRAVQSQKHARERTLERTEKATSRAASQQYRALQARLEQEQQAKSQASETAKRQHLRDVAGATVAAGEMGLIGNSAGDLEQLFALRASEAEDTRTRNLGFVEAQILNSMQTVHEQQKTALENAAGGSIAGVDIGGVLGTAVGSATTALGNYAAATNTPKLPGSPPGITSRPLFGQQ